MSTERLPLGLNTIIPETYQTHAEAFAKCLQHKLLSLGKLTGGKTSGETVDRCGCLPIDEEPEQRAKASDSLPISGARRQMEHSEGSLPEEGSIGDSVEESSNRLTCASSEDSTVGSWCSCQDELVDSDADELNGFAMQVKGSPKMRNSNTSRFRRKEFREKPRKPRGVDVAECEKPPVGQVPDDSVDDSASQFILFDGSEDTSEPEKTETTKCSDEGLAAPLDNDPIRGSSQEQEIAEEESDMTKALDQLSLASDEVLEKVDESIGSNDSGIEVTKLSCTPPPSVLIEKDHPEGCHEPDEDEPVTQRLRRSSSLKTSKTPPDTPGAKKIVRFADALGLDLADVRTFLDEIPKIPSSAYEDLHLELPAPVPPPLKTPLTLVPLFEQPGRRMNFLGRLQRQKICLESVSVTDACVLAVAGVVRVQNLSYHKSVHVRYSLNNWQTYSDLQASYVPNSSDGFSDKFSFVLYGHTLKMGERLEFALRMDCCGNQYWDNNGGVNYVLHCLLENTSAGYFGFEGDDSCHFY